ncbi:hypothetical protein BN946_scf185011.g19 [Trametes cinnabarina]|uniref:Uncharacterized protein n=1 Tax=Pycnoporus cinnabarinus TaxID=5643 RepID=A0A060SPS6_PYCCI|nr:hypothetical protein BN946_scf185011.g19 [Trametes cinnabarina]
MFRAAITHPLLSLVGAAALLNYFAIADAKLINNAELRAKQAQTVARLKANLPCAASPSVGSGVKNITFSNPRASEFYVDGTSIPDVNWDIGPSWSGLLPISADPNETRQLFFWFFPPGPQGSLDDLIFSVMCRSLGPPLGRVARPDFGRAIVTVTGGLADHSHEEGDPERRTASTAVGASSSFWLHNSHDLLPGLRHVQPVVTR